jgi:hypothetical protein
MPPNVAASPHGTSTNALILVIYTPLFFQYSETPFAPIAFPQKFNIHMFMLAAKRVSALCPRLGDRIPTYNCRTVVSITRASRVVSTDHPIPGPPPSLGP